MTHRITSGIAAAIAVLLSGCGQQALVDPAPEGIATVDGRAVPAWKLEHQLARPGHHGVAPDPHRLVAELIEREQLVARALQLGLDHDPAVQRAWETALIAKLKERELEPALRATRTAELNPADRQSGRRHGGSEEQVRLAILRLDAGPKVGPDKVRRLEQRLEEARGRVASLPPGTAGFGPLALEYSDDDATRARGGEVGWLTADDSRCPLDPEVLAAGFALRCPGEVSPVVRTETGLCLVRLMDRRRGGLEPDTDEALASHCQHLARIQTVEASFLATIRGTIPVTVNTSLVEQVIARARAAAPAPEHHESEVHLSAVNSSSSPREPLRLR